MSIATEIQYFKRNKEGLPDPRGDLSLSILPRAIALANSEMDVEQKKPKKRGQNFWYSELSVIIVVCKLTLLNY